MKKKLKIKLFADGANLKDIFELNKSNKIKGFTTNPSLMKKEGILIYENFAKKLLKIIKKKSVSFEVFSDELKTMEAQANKISSWGKNVYVKIPITNTKGKSTASLINNLNRKNINCNITAIFTIDQVKHLLKNIDFKSKNIFSIFAGRIADTGVDPKDIIQQSIKLTKKYKNIEILWASVREPYNIVEADSCDCHIVTVPPSILKKLNKFNFNLKKYSLSTVKQFYIDAQKSKLRIK
jgi:transaldolase